MITLAAGVLMTVVEREHYPSIGSGLWWAIQTTTTVGYGDNVPTTFVGRFVAAVVMLFGIGILTVITAAITSTFVARSRLEQKSVGPEAPTAEQLRRLDGRLERIEAALSGLLAPGAVGRRCRAAGGGALPSARRAARPHRSRADAPVVARTSCHPYEESRSCRPHSPQQIASTRGRRPATKQRIVAVETPTIEGTE